MKIKQMCIECNGSGISLFGRCGICDATGEVTVEKEAPLQHAREEGRESAASSTTATAAPAT